MNIWLRYPVLALCLALALGACGDYASITDVDPNAPLVADSALPTVEFGDPPSPFEEGSVVSMTVGDDTEVRSAALLALSEDDQILWGSDTVRIGPALEVEVEISVDGLPGDFPFGENVEIIAWVEDGQRKSRYSGTSDDAPLSLADASGLSVSLFEGQTFSLGEDAEIGAFAYNDVDREVYFTNVTGNYVGGFSLESMDLMDWRVFVGSRPRQLAFRKYAWGPEQATLAVFNSGGTDISVVDVTGGLQGGDERWRITVPIIEAIVAADTIPLSTDATSIIIQCPSNFCNRPQLYFGSPQLGGEGKVVTRSVSITSPDVNEGFDILTPRYSPALATDSSVTVSAFEIDRKTGQRTRIMNESGVSLCGTLAFGGTVLAVSDEVQGSFFIAESGAAKGACSDKGGRVLRFDFENGEYVVSRSAIVNFDFDGNLRDGRVVHIDTNRDASLVVMADAENVFVTNGDLRRLATIPTTGVQAVALLEGHEGGPGPVETGAVFAVATNESVDVYETEHFRRVASFPVANPASGRLMFVRTRTSGGLALFGVTGDQTALTLLQTSLSELAAGLPD